MFLLDTNVVSELLVKRRPPNEGVSRWSNQARRQNAKIYLSVLTLGEMYYGAEKAGKTNPAQARAIFRTVEGLREQFSERLIDIDLRVAREWSRLIAIDYTNKTDALLAATAAVHGLVVVTRNEKHFAPLGVPFINPFA